MRHAKRNTEGCGWATRLVDVIAACDQLNVVFISFISTRSSSRAAHGEVDHQRQDFPFPLDDQPATRAATPAARGAAHR